MLHPRVFKKNWNKQTKMWWKQAFKMLFKSRAVSLHASSLNVWHPISTISLIPTAINSLKEKRGRVTKKKKMLIKQLRRQKENENGMENNRTMLSDCKLGVASCGFLEEQFWLPSIKQIIHLCYDITIWLLFL